MTDAFLVTVRVALKYPGGRTNAVIQMITDIVEVVGVLVSFLLVNRVGRRPLLLWTTVWMAVVLFICGGLGTIPADQRSKSVNSVIAAMIIIYVL